MGKPVQAKRVSPKVDPLAGWKRFSDANGISFLAPQDFNVLETKEFPFAVRVLDVQNRVDRVVLVRKRAKPEGMSMQAFQDELITEVRNRRKDFNDLHSWWQFYRLPGYFFTFRYTWDGRPIHALIYQDPSASVPFEIRYVAVEESFSLEEAEAIIRSVVTGTQ